MAGCVARPSHGGCWGVSRVLRLEHPGLRVISADAPPSNPTRTPTLTPNPYPTLHRTPKTYPQPEPLPLTLTLLLALSLTLSRPTLRTECCRPARPPLSLTPSPLRPLR